MRFLTTALGVVCCAALLGACGDSPRRVEPARPPSVSASPAPADIRDVCAGEQPFHRSSLPYSGPAPHLVMGVQLDDAVNAHGFPPQAPDLPAAWAAIRATPGLEDEVFASGVKDVADYERVQLLLCMSPPRLKSPTPVDRCGPYWKTYVDVLSVYYEFGLFEARTGVRVTSFQIDGTRKTCPSSIRIGANNPGYALAIDDGALIAAIRPFVEKNF